MKLGVTPAGGVRAGTWFGSGKDMSMVVETRRVRYTGPSFTRMYKVPGFTPVKKNNQIGLDVSTCNSAAYVYAFAFITIWMHRI